MGAPGGGGKRLAVALSVCGYVLLGEFGSGNGMFVRVCGGEGAKGVLQWEGALGGVEGRGNEGEGERPRQL